MAQYQIPKPYYHPLTLFEMMRGNHTVLIDLVLKTLEAKLEEANLSYTLDIKLKDFLEINEKPTQAPATVASNASFD